MWKTSKQGAGQSAEWLQQVLHWHLLFFLFFSFVKTTHLFCGFSFLLVGGTSSRKCRPTLGKDWKFCSIVTSPSIWRINNNLNCRKRFVPMTLSEKIKELRTTSAMKWKAPLLSTSYSFWPMSNCLPWHRFCQGHLWNDSSD